MIPEIDGEQLARDLASGRALQLVDVREEEEIELAAFPGATHIPLGDLARGALSLDRARPVVVICHHGVRSLHGAAMLLHLGFTEVASLRGGIDRWSVAIDPRVPRY